MRRALYVVLLAATTSLGACDSRPITGSLSEQDGTPNGNTGGTENGGGGGGDGTTVLAESIPPAGFTACTTDTWQTYSQAQLVAGCTRCHSEMSTYAGITARSAAIRDSIANGTMPNDGTALPASDVAKLTRWVDCDLAP